MFRHAPKEGDGPCSHMPGLLSQLSDGTLTGLMRWYATHHTKGCPRCASALESLIETRSRLHALCVSPEGELKPLSLLTPERRAAVEAAWEKIESGD